MQKQQQQPNKSKKTNNLPIAQRRHYFWCLRYPYPLFSLEFSSLKCDRHFLYFCWMAMFIWLLFLCARTCFSNPEKLKQMVEIWYFFYKESTVYLWQNYEYLSIYKSCWDVNTHQTYAATFPLGTKYIYLSKSWSCLHNEVFFKIRVAVTQTKGRCKKINESQQLKNTKTKQKRQHYFTLSH